ncbi:MAG: aminopeptidase, partial [Candidatus Dormiibacterota bacterium]
DPYVESVFSEETAALIRGLRPWLTNEYDHNALRADGARVLGRLIDLAQGRA